MEPEEVSARWLITSLVRAAIDAIRRNKLAAILAAGVLAILVALALDSRFDGLAGYQESIVPRLLRLETGLQRELRSAENATGEWRAYYFENAHRQVRDILRAARLYRPDAYFARRKHRQFIRYYELLNSEFHAVQIQLRTQPGLDYLGELRSRTEKLKPTRDAWAEWALSPKAASDF
jgi:hypothetical protein